jgi:hypothetical protein
MKVYEDLDEKEEKKLSEKQTNRQMWRKKYFF